MGGQYQTNMVRGTLLASYALLFQIGGLAGAVGLQILQTVITMKYNLVVGFEVDIPSVPSILGLHADPSQSMDFYRSLYHLLDLFAGDSM